MVGSGELPLSSQPRRTRGAEGPSTDGHGQARAQLTAAEAEARGHEDARVQGKGGGTAVRLCGSPFRSRQPWRKRQHSSRLRRGARSRRMRCPSCAAARRWRARSGRACFPPAPGCSSSATKKGRPRPACCPRRCWRTGTRPPVRQRINREVWEVGEDACRYASEAALVPGLRTTRGTLSLAPAAGAGGVASHPALLRGPSPVGGAMLLRGDSLSVHVRYEVGRPRAESRWRARALAARRF